MPTKVKVNIPFDVNRCLENDMKSFGFIKNDGNINKNKFINLLLKNYYLVFSSQEDKLIKKIENHLFSNYSLSIDKNIANEILSISKQQVYEEKYYNDYSMQFIIIKENEKIFNTIEKYYLRNRSISQYFREMFISYATHKQDYREKLLFPDLVNKIEKAISENKKIIITFKNNESIIMDPFALDQTKEELYNYLIGVTNNIDGTREICSRKLHKIDNVIISNDELVISKKEKYYLTKTMEHGSQFPINQVCDSIIELTTKGEKNYNDFYLNRPKYYKKEGNKYYFDCSYAQLEFYFFKFGKDVQIISPLNLRNRFSKKYHQALDNYRKQ